MSALGEADGLNGACAIDPKQENETGDARGQKRTRDSEASQEPKKPKFIDMKKLGNASFLDNTLRFVRAMMKQVDLLDSLDQTPNLLACSLGVIDLKTGELISHHPRFLSTKQVDVAYSTTEPQSRV
jgi:phage/plasmid-associated DNA primase